MVAKLPKWVAILVRWLAKFVRWIAKFVRWVANLQYCTGTTNQPRKVFPSYCILGIAGERGLQSITTQAKQLPNLLQYTYSFSKLIQIQMQIIYFLQFEMVCTMIYVSM